MLERLGTGETYETFVRDRCMHGTLEECHMLYLHDPHTLMHTIDSRRCLELLAKHPPDTSSFSPEEFARRFYRYVPFTILSVKKMPVDYRAALIRVWSSKDEIDQDLLHRAIEAMPGSEQKSLRALLESGHDGSRGALSVSADSSREGGLNIMDQHDT